MQITQTVTTPPTFNLAEDLLPQIKAWIRVEGEDDDDLITDLISMAIQNIERRLGVRLAACTMTFGYTWFAPITDIPISPVSAVNSITYLDEAGDRQTLNPDHYRVALSTLAPSIYRKEWPVHLIEIDSVQVECEVGFADGELPADLKHAIAVMVSDHYDNRQGATASERAVNALIGTYRNAWVA